MKKTFLLSLTLVFLAAGCNASQPANPETPIPPTTAVTSSSTSAAQNTVYENDFMKITIPQGWQAAEGVKQETDNNGTHYISDPSTVNITSGNYILYINTQASQASGADGGRFAEIAMGAPSADVVVPQQPSPPCGSEMKSPGIPGFSRVDLYVSSKDKSDFCVIPTNGKTVWYFSYFTDSNGGYFNDYQPGTNPGLVITLAYNSKDVNSFPVQGSQELSTMLSQMTNIVKTLEIKKK